MPVETVQRVQCMEPMTPEERFTKIENALQSLTEMQARHDMQIGDLITQTEKQNGGIRDLILVSRTFLESQKETTEQIRELREVQQSSREAQQAFHEAQQALIEQQRSTEEKLHALIDTVDRIIRNQKN